MSIALVGIVLAAVMAAAFLLGMRTGVSVLILIRPLCDRIFDSGRFDEAVHGISSGALINIVVICVMLCNLVRIWRCVPFKLMTMWLPFLLMAFVAVTYSPVQFDGFRKFLTYVTFSGVFMFSFIVVKSERDVLFFLKLVIFSSVLPALYGLFQTVSGIDWFLDSRVQSTFSHPNIFAFYILAIIATIFFLLATDRGRMSEHLRVILNVYLVPLVALLIMTKTRSAWVGCFILFLVYGLVYDKRALLLVLAAPVLALAIPAVSDRLMDLASGNDYNGVVGGVNVNSYTWRQILWGNSFTYIWQQPILGYGLDSFHFYSPLFFPLEPRGTFAHNVYVQLLFETGFVGLFSFFWIFWQNFAWLFRYWRFDRRGSTMAAGIMGTYLIVCFSDNVLEYLSFNWCFWFSFGLILTQLGSYRFRARNSGRRRTFWRRSKTEGAASFPGAIQASSENLNSQAQRTVRI
jgi:O-antigen ligase